MAGGRMTKAPRKRKYNRKPKTVTGTRKIAQQVVSKALKERGLKKLEFKYLSELGNSAIAGSSALWASSYNFLNPIAQGDNHNNRDGYEIQPVAVQIKLSASCLNGTSANLRILLIRWDAIAPPTSLGDFFESPTTPIDITTSLFNLENRSYFSVYVDKRVDITNLADSDGRYLFDYYLDCRSHKPCKFIGGLAGEGQMTQGRYYLLYMATDSVTLNFSNRFLFTG